MHIQMHAYSHTYVHYIHYICTHVHAYIRIPHKQIYTYVSSHNTHTHKNTHAYTNTHTCILHTTHANTRTG